LLVAPARHRSACASCRRASRSASSSRNMPSSLPPAASSRSQRRMTAPPELGRPSRPGRGTSGRSRSGQRAPAVSAQPRAVDGAGQRRVASRVPARNPSQTVQGPCRDSWPLAWAMWVNCVGSRQPRTGRAVMKRL
jgi:hypothetical protein